MISQIRIQNLGKLADATVRIRPLTVLAGANNTGKSFFSKGVYSICHAMNADHFRIVHSSAAATVDSDLQKLDAYLLTIPEGHISELPNLVSASEKIRQARHMANKAAAAASPLKEGMSHPSCYEEPYPDLVKAADLLDAAFAEFKALATQALSNANEAHFWNFLRDMEKHVAWLSDVYRFSRSEFVGRGLMKIAEENMLKNFQVGTISGLQGHQEEGVTIRIPEMGVFHFSPGQQSYDAKLLPEYYSRVVYLDSPAFWRVRVALENERRARQKYSINGREQMDGVPKYFYDLEELLSGGELTGDAPFPQVAERIANVIGGKVVRDDFGHLKFEEDGKSFPLSSTAMGVANLGILALLIERKLLDPGAFLFIDEPESNLHPAWQVEMVRALLDLARGGVNVVMATHSADIMERLRALVSKHPELEELIALNHFSPEGVNVRGEKSFRARAGDILEELTEEFAESYMGKVELEAAK